MDPPLPCQANRPPPTPLTCPGPAPEPALPSCPYVLGVPLTPLPWAPSPPLPLGHHHLHSLSPRGQAPSLRLGLQARRTCPPAHTPSRGRLVHGHLDPSLPAAWRPPTPSRGPSQPWAAVKLSTAHLHCPPSPLPAVPLAPSPSLSFVPLPPSPSPRRPPLPVPLSCRPLPCVPSPLSPNVPSGRHSGWAVTMVTDHMPLPPGWWAPVPRLTPTSCITRSPGARQQLPRPRRHMSVVRPARRAGPGSLESAPTLRAPPTRTGTQPTWEQA